MSTRPLTEMEALIARAVCRSRAINCTFEGRASCRHVGRCLNGFGDSRSARVEAIAVSKALADVGITGFPSGEGAPGASG